MSGATRNKLGAATLVLIALAFVVAVIATNVWLRGARIDLTENNLYTLGDGTQAVLDGIDEPINLYLFFSNEATETLPTLRTYATRVREMLEELAANAPDGKLVAERRRSAAVLRGGGPRRAARPARRDARHGRRPVYFGLAGTNSVGTTDRIPFFQPDPRKEAFLEYDLARLIYNLANTDKTVVGLLTSAPIGGGFDPQTQQPSQPWVVVEQAKQLLEVRTLPASVLTIDDDIDVLWIVHPAMLDDSTLYAVDQFVMRGGRALIFVDPHAEILAGADPTGFGIGAARRARRSSGCSTRGASRSIRRASSPTIATRSASAGASSPIRHIGLLGLDAEAMSQDDPITSGLSTVNVGRGGAFRARRRRDGEADAAAHVERRVRSDAGGAVPVPAGSRGAAERLHAERQGVRARRAPRRAAEIGVPGRRARRPRSARRPSTRRSRARTWRRPRTPTSCSSATSTS